MALTRQTMTDEQRKSVALEYLKAYDNGGVTSTGGSILDLFASDAQVYFPKWGIANGRDQIGQLFGDVGSRGKSITHHYASFNWIFSGSDLLACEGTSHGEHVDGPWRAGVPEWGAGRWCDVFEIRDWLIQRCFIYLDPDYAGKDTARYPWLKTERRAPRCTPDLDHGPLRPAAGRRPEDADPPPALHRRPLRRCRVGRDAGDAATRTTTRPSPTWRWPAAPTSTRRSPRPSARSRRGAGMAAADRGRILLKLADLIEANAEELARLESLDTGHPLRDSRALDVPRTAACFRYFGGMADKFEGDVVPVEAGFLNYLLREPVGVVGQVVPWNFPLMFTSWKMGPALAAGNCIVLKPAEITPLTHAAGSPS